VSENLIMNLEVRKILFSKRFSNVVLIYIFLVLSFAVADHEFWWWRCGFKYNTPSQFDASKLVSFVDNSDKYNFKNVKLHLTTCKNLRCSYIFIIKLF
jgi:hypothetical protein